MGDNQAPPGPELSSDASTSKTEAPQLLPGTSVKQQEATSSKSVKPEVLSSYKNQENRSLPVQCTSCYSVQDLLVQSFSFCKRGHFVCLECSTAEGRCTFCRRLCTGDQNKENVEDLVHCIFALDGCTRMLQNHEASAHHAICEYRPIPCFAFGCPYNSFPGIRYKQVITHFLSHKGLLVSTATATVVNAFKSELNDLESCRWVHSAFEFKDFVFFIVGQKHESLLGIWAWILGNNTDAKMFRVKITIGSQEIIQHKWDGPVHSIRKTRAEIMSGGACLLTSWDVMKNLIKGNPSDPNAKYTWDIRFQLYDSPPQAQAQPQQPWASPETETIIQLPMSRFVKVTGRSASREAEMFRRDYAALAMTQPATLEQRTQTTNKETLF